MLNLHSFLAESIQRFIDLRRLSGTNYHHQALLLNLFDHFVAEQAIDNEPKVTKKLIEDYQQSLSRLAPSSRRNYMCVVRQLCQYLAARDPCIYVPESEPVSSSGAPYIYSHKEVLALMAAADTLSPTNSLRPHTYSTLLGLLYSTGLRIGEALALNLDDFHQDQQRLFIASGKFHKARWIPLTPSTCKALTSYVQCRLSFLPQGSKFPLFVNLRGHRMHYCNVNQDFHRLLAHCGIVQVKRIRPCLHSFRHTFAVTRLLAWYREGCDVNAKLPALATYMGHVNIASTMYYLHPTAELLTQVGERFHSHFLNHVVKTQEGELS